jgi:putative transposase
MKKRFSEEQIVKILQEAERADTEREVIRKYNISDTTFYRWKKLYGGMGVSEVKRLKELEAENAKLKKLLAEQILINDALKDVVEKKW